MIDLPGLELLVAALEGEDWVLVGGTMTHAHCQMAGVHYSRTTHDLDLVVNPVGATSLGSAARALIGAGFGEVRPLSPDGFLHRFVSQEGVEVDVMAPDSDLSPTRWRGFRVVQSPGSKSALKHLVEVPVGAGTLQLPDVRAAAALKGHAIKLPSPNRERHVQDFIALMACGASAGKSRELSKSERGAFNNALRSDYFATADTWMATDPDHWPDAVAELRRVFPGRQLRLPELVAREVGPT